jgi:PEP-CTERM/exosortase A-associated glycosyltransferase
LLINVLHVLDHSLPEQSGYAYRSHAILKELHNRGVKLDVVTSPKQGVVNDVSSEVDGISYQRTVLSPHKSTSGMAGQVRTIRSTRNTIAELLRRKQASVIHAHSPCLNGLAAMGQDVPLLYEMRSSWEDAAVSVGTTCEGSLRYRVSKALETFVIGKADAVVVICEGLKNELLARGVTEEKITVVPNALPPEMFELPAESAVADIRKQYVPQDSKIIGFFGSFFEWEGVDELVQVLPLVVEAVPDAHLLLAGGGRQEGKLRALVSRLGLDQKVTFAGRVSHTDIKSMYGAVDVMAFPRVSHRLTDMVTPIKPLEAMAQKAVVIASDVGGHKELIKDNNTGLLYPAGDREAFAETIIRVLQNPESFSEMRARAREYVEMERRWSVVAERYLPVYEALGYSVE